MKFVIPAMVAAMLATCGSVYAQSLNLGPGGISVDPRSSRERAIDREMRREEIRRDEARRDRWERRHEMRGEHRGEMRGERRGQRCRTITTQEETRRGVVRRTTRVCD